MSKALLMGLDLGGGGVRCLLVEPHSAQVVTAFRAWSSAPVRGVPLGIQYDPDATFAALAGVAREALAKAGADADSVLGIAATSMRHGSALLDAAGAEIAVCPNRDARGTGAALMLAAQRGAELHARTGHWPNPVQPGARLRWFASEAPETLERAAHHLSLSDWIGFRLCGEVGSEASQASETSLLEIERTEWAWDLIDSFELPRRIFPELRAPGSELGTLSAVAAEALGLRPGIPVAVGGGDTQCGLLGSGVLRPGALGIVGGTSAPVLQVAAQPVLDPEGRLWAVHHVVPGRWALESNAGGAGEALDWLAGLLYPQAAQPVLQLLAEAKQAPVASAGLVSTLGAEVHDARALGLPVGNLTLNYFTTGGTPGRRGHLARSVLEGMACSFRANAGQIESATGVNSEELRMTGGLSRSPFFTQLIADVAGRPVEVSSVSEASALGAALCAGLGAKVFGSFEEGVEALVAVERRHEPGADREFWEERYPAWNALRRARAASDQTASGFAIRALSETVLAAEPEASAFRPRILVTCDLDETGLAALERIGEVEHQSYRSAMRLLTGRSLVEALEGVHVFVTEVDVVDAASLLEARDLRVVGVCRGDAVNVDVEACTALGIPVLNTPGRNADAVADLAVAFMLMLARKLAAANTFLREPGGEAGDMGRMGRAFAALQGRELWQKTVGLVGLGAVGRKVVARLRPFGARCIVYDPYQDTDALRLAGAEPVDLETLLREADFVSLHAAVTDASRGLIGAEQLAAMKPGSMLVNTARAALIDEEALLAALHSGQLGGAALDVFDLEPPGSDHPLLQLDNVIATPHVGGNTLEVAAHQGQIVASELERLARGEAPQHALNAEVLAQFRWAEPRPAPPPELAEKLGRGPGPAVTDLQKPQPKKSRGSASPAGAAPATPARGGPMSEVEQSMQKLVACFVQRIVTDAQLGEFARSADDVVLHFTLSDLGSQFHFGFRDNALVGAVGAPQETAPVQLKMRAELLDGMFTGTANAMQAAMNGELSFSGDTAKAMTLQQLQRDLSRIYRDAREEVGDPGDLASIPRPGGAAAATPATPASAAPASVRASSLPAGDVRHEVCRIVDELYAQHLITATGGNVSLRRPEAPDEAWITPSQLFKGDLRPEILVRVGMDGRALDEDARSPSSEALMHTAVLAAKPEAQAVIHCHAANATVLVNAELPFLPISTEAAFFHNIGRIPFVMPGTQELAERIVEAMGDGWAVLMQNHGLLVAGRTLRRAADMAEIIERTCEVIVGCYAAGKEPPVLPAETVKTLASYGDLMA